MAFSCTTGEFLLYSPAETVLGKTRKAAAAAAIATAGRDTVYTMLEVKLLKS